MIAKIKLRVYQSLSALNSDDFIGFHYSDTLFSCSAFGLKHEVTKCCHHSPIGLRQQAIFEVLDNVDTTHVYYATMYQWSDCPARVPYEIQ